ncbi:MAG TPA: polyphenol oxidase family protein [Candidatus Aminicenantes bacterium]|nr:polyphenol oxidase family protein [Candidatus Aminicenantes bacterium]
MVKLPWVYRFGGAGFEGLFSSRHLVVDDLFPDSPKQLLKQVHSATVLTLDAPLTTLPEADGLLTTSRGFTLVVKTADCVPVLAYNPRVPFVAALHAGWRGIQGGIFPSFFQEALSIASRRELTEFTRFWIGPSICGRCYTVGEELVPLFSEAGFPESLFSRNGKGLVLDLHGAVRFALRELGFSTSSVEEIPLCTLEDSRLFSYRRGEREGRLHHGIRLLP